MWLMISDSLPLILMGHTGFYEVVLGVCFSNSIPFHSQKEA
jgi:hypothetical protein